MNARELLISLGRETFLVIDQLLNAVLLGLAALVMAVVTGNPQNPAYSDETLSAHAWRAEKRDKPWGKFFRPVIDWMFLWQKPDPTIAVNGVVVTGHCQRAYLKEKLKRGLPPEYRE